MKRQIKKTLSVCLILSLVLCIGLPAFGVSDEKPAQVTGLNLTTENTLRHLKVSWKAMKGADGYQIVRSTNGKAKTYEKIATIRNAKQHAYMDEQLKNATTYYYKVRAFRKVNGKTLFGKYSAASNLSTRMTKSAADKLYQNAYEVYHDWFQTTAYVNEDTLADLNDGYLGNVEHPTIKTKKQLKKFFAQYFTGKVYKEPLKYYWSYDGDDRLFTYYLGESRSDPYTDQTNKSKLSNIQDTSCVYTRTGRSADSNKKIAETYHIVYQSGKWLFDSGFSSAFPLYYGENH